MSVGIEALFTSALGLQPPWVVEDVKLDTATRSAHAHHYSLPSATLH